MPATGFAVYDFIGGTDSTSVSGATIGDGVTAGSITVDFGGSNALLDMEVRHNSITYLVSGNLFVVVVDPAVDPFSGALFSVDVNASTDAPGSLYNPGCPTIVRGHLPGPLVQSNPPATPSWKWTCHMTAWTISSTPTWRSLRTAGSAMPAVPA